MAEIAALREMPEWKSFRVIVSESARDSIPSRQILSLHASRICQRHEDEDEGECLCDSLTARGLDENRAAFNGGQYICELTFENLIRGTGDGIAWVYASAPQDSFAKAASETCSEILACKLLNNKKQRNPTKQKLPK